MSLKDNWIDRQNGVDNVDAEDINKVARAVIEAEERLGDYIQTPATATVGQTIVVKSVDTSGKPTEWQAADMPSGGSGGGGGDIPAALPNPYALTFTGAVTGSYDGSEAVSVEIPSTVTDDHINSLIDTKLGVIENGSY